MSTKNKLAKFADMETYPNCLQYSFEQLQETGFPLRGRWHEEYFHNQHPIVLELGCGKGEYTVGLARRYRNKNFIGIDIKGARMWTGATAALKEELSNVAFVRTHIELIEQFFAPNEVSEIWITFCDPQMKKVNKRLTCTRFMNRYSHIMQPGGLIHLKCDSNFLFTYTEELLKANNIEPEYRTRNLYSPTSVDGLGEEASSIQTYYESMWRARGIDIKYLCFRLRQGAPLVEPNVEIPLDEYRSYSREKRSGSEKHV